MNHPHRRVAALALSARRWRSIEPLLNAAGAAQLRELLTAWRDAKRSAWKAFAGWLAALLLVLLLLLLKKKQLLM